YSGYPDCRPEFITAFEKMANLAIAATAQPSPGAPSSAPTSPEGRGSQAARPRTPLPPGEVEKPASGFSGEGLRQTIRIHTPIIAMNKAEIIREGLRLNVEYALTISCYDPDLDGVPCGRCDSCLLRAKGFQENHRADPAQNT
ncbi:MAG: 7-cyano-7-deazaguanine synthase, partial [Alphaproteobacteria bacterium]